jgi:hypothetical protein
MLGNLLSPQEGPTQEGPRLTDLRAQSSAYGQAVPITYGTVRVAGNIIWSTDIQETRNEEEVGGGKGGGPTATQVTYTYRVSCAVAMCEGEIDGVRRIWMNNEIVYDGGSSDPGTAIAGASFAGNWRVYHGSEDQQPDALIQSYEGAGNTPAFRSTAYMVFEDLQLAKFGNRTPNIEMEVVKVGNEQPFRILKEKVVEPVPQLYNPWITDVYSTGFRVRPSNVTVLYDGFPDGIQINVADRDRANAEQKCYYYDFDGNIQGSEATSRIEIIKTGNIIPDKAIYPDGDSIYMGSFDGYPAEWGYQNVYYRGRYAAGGAVFQHDPSYDHTNKFYELGGAYTNVPLINMGGGVQFYTPYSRKLDNLFPRSEGFRGCFFSSDGLSMYVLTCTQDGTNPVGNYPTDKWYEIKLNGPFDPYIARSGTTEVNADSIGFGASSPRYAGADELGDRWGIFYGGNTAAFLGVSRMVVEPDNVHVMWLGGNQGSPKVGYWAFEGNKLVAKNCLTLRTTELGLNGFSVYNTMNGRPWATNGIGVWITGLGGSQGGNSKIIVATRNPGVTGGSVTLRSIVEDLCQRAGLSLFEIDATQLTDSVNGYVVPNRMSIRGALEPLQAAFFFDAVETDGILKFVKRGGSSVVTINHDELAATDGEMGELPDIIHRTRLQEMELPRELTVNYWSLNGDYAPGTQYERRLITSAVNSRGFDMPIVFDDAKARQVVAVNMFAAWQGREVLSFQTTNKYAHVNPTDVVTVDNGTITFLARITKRSEGGNGIVQFEAVEENPTIYTQTAEAGTVLPGSQSVSLPAPTIFQVINVPPLRDGDGNNPVVYAAGAGVDANWNGAAVVKSIDNGMNFTDTTVSIDKISIMGSYVDPTDTSIGLAQWTGGDVFDEKNVCRVSVYGGTLSSKTEAEVLNGANTCLIGNEILQFKNATLVSANTYDLTGLLRERLGTSSAGHTKSDSFLMLDKNTTRAISLDSSMINADLQFRAVTFGTSIRAARTVLIDDYAPNNLKPLAPVELRAVKLGPQGTGDLSLSWKRRARINAAWINNSDVPLDETTESYDIEIWTTNGVTLKRTFSANTTTSVTYTQAMQVTDWGNHAEGASIAFMFKVYQNSSKAGVGRGQVATKTVSFTTSDLTVDPNG